MDAYAGPISVSPPPSQGVPLWGIMLEVRRRAAVVLVLAVLGAIAGYAFSRTLPSSYTASSVIAVEGDRFAIPELAGALRSDASADPLPVVRTEMQALTSRDLLQTVVGNLHLAEDPEFNADLRPPSILARAKAAIQSLLPSSPAPKGAADPLEGVLNSVDQHLSIFQDNRSLAIQVLFTSHDPQKSAQIVNEVVSQYISRRAKRRETVNQGANAAITQRVAEVRDGLSALERKMQDMRDQNQVVLLRAGSVGQQQLEELTTALARASVERAQLQSTYDRAQALVRQGASGSLASVLNSPTISRLRDQETAASQRVAELSSRYGSAFPGLRSAQAELGSVHSQVAGETQRILQSLATQLTAAKDNEVSLQRQLDEARTNAVQSENVSARLEQLKQEVTSQRALYQTLLEREQQTVNQPVAAQTPDVYVVSKAAPPASPSGPNNKMAGALGGVGGALLGCLFAVARVRSTSKVVGPSELSSWLNLDTVAVLPRRSLGRGRDGLHVRVVSEPQGSDAQTVRDLRSRVRHLGRSSSPRVALLVATAVGDPPARLAFALARLAARDGERVLLIDADLSAPAIDRLAGMQAGDLHEVFGGRDWRDVVTVDDRTALHVLAPARPMADAGTLLGSIAFQNLLVDGRTAYDLVIIAGPPAGTLDAVTLAERADATLLLLDAADRKDVATAAADALARRTQHGMAVVMLSR